MTRTDPPNPTPDARPPLTDAEHQALTEHLTTVTSAARIAVLALTDGRAVLGPRFPGLLADLGSEIAAAQRIVHGDDDTAALAIAGVLAPTDDDVDEAERAWWNTPQGGKMRAALDVFAARLAARLPAPADSPAPPRLGPDDRAAIADVVGKVEDAGGDALLLADDVIATVNQLLDARRTTPAAPCPHDDITGQRCEGCGAPVVVERALSLADLKTGGTAAGQ